MESKAQYPVREEVTQDALSGGRAGFKMWQQGDDGVQRCVPGAVFGIRLQLHIGAGGFPSMQEWLIEEEEVSAYPEGHRRGGGNESGENLHVHAQASEYEEDGRMNNIHKDFRVKETRCGLLQYSPPKPESQTQLRISLKICIGGHNGERGHGHGQEEIWHLLQLKVTEETHIPVHVLDVRIKQGEGSHAPQWRRAVLIWHPVAPPLSQG